MTFETIRAKDIVLYIRRADTQIIDIREPMDYKQGHIPSAINIPYDDFENGQRNIPKDKLLILYCERGNLSLLLARDLSNEGYMVKNIYGGLNAYRGYLEQ
ncbi:Rhodanese-related sulfurtransferase [Anaerocolumna jejuensis DSM 15929]|jgi:rhodanese-related sulfurtransferase|uniref:Rhodanese-related sulfurtransferase n=1 Tax=Anaerocolumna jejuensis DSM 15929 TaxID=1121322 RepID=A0A1M7CX70_9FIRM|nr:rhodanese-like domain-containing protein [Anaerocolumna jejuensis]SHL71816.1 Rhodanese-related sulfurtransferase [Anaerocolumna jejuensis DSM 15929]